jgi:hypothetical protein
VRASRSASACGAPTDRRCRMIRYLAAVGTIAAAASVARLAVAIMD